MKFFLFSILVLVILALTKAAPQVDAATKAAGGAAGAAGNAASGGLPGGVPAAPGGLPAVPSGGIGGIPVIGGLAKGFGF